MFRPIWGVITLAIMGAAPAVAQTAADRAAIIERLSQADADGDGAITRAELIASRAANFARLERNGDGVLSDADIPVFLQATSAGAQFNLLKTQFDANRDGKITRDELVKGPTVFFDLADANHNNVVTDAELKAAAAAVRAGKGAR